MTDYFSKKFSDDILPAFLGTLRSTRTRAEYLNIIKQVCAFSQKDFLSLEQEDIESYFSIQKERVEEEQLSPHTYNVRLSALSSMATYVSEHYPDVEYTNYFADIERMPTDTLINMNKVPSLREIDLILSAARDESPMLYTIISLVARVTLPASRIVALNKRNILRTEDGRTLLYFPASSPHSKDYQIALPNDVSVILENYLSSGCISSADGYVFLNKRGNVLTIKNLDTYFKKIVEKSGVDLSYTIKDIRTRAILELTKVAADNGLNVSDISEYAGIKSVRMQTFVSTVANVANCPADLVNYQIKP